MEYPTKVRTSCPSDPAFVEKDVDGAVSKLPFGGVHERVDIIKRPDLVPEAAKEDLAAENPLTHPTVANRDSILIKNITKINNKSVLLQNLLSLFLPPVSEWLLILTHSFVVIHKLSHLFITLKSYSNVEWVLSIKVYQSLFVVQCWASFEATKVVVEQAVGI